MTQAEADQQERAAWCAYQEAIQASRERRSYAGIIRRLAALDRWMEADEDKLQAELNGEHEMTRDQIINEMKARGYTQVITYGGPIPIDEWHPYGLDTVNKTPGMNYHGEIIEGNKVQDIPQDGKPSESPFRLGVWSFAK